MGYGNGFQVENLDLAVKSVLFWHGLLVHYQLGFRYRAKAAIEPKKLAGLLVMTTPNLPFIICLIRWFSHSGRVLHAPRDFEVSILILYLDL